MVYDAKKSVRGVTKGQILRESVSHTFLPPFMTEGTRRWIIMMLKNVLIKGDP